MAISPVDRDPQYMKDTWGTNQLITDYTADSKKILQEVMYDPATVDKSSKKELFEDSDENFLEYGIEPTYKLEKGKQVI
jgi:hypothetical protein